MTPRSSTGARRLASAIDWQAEHLTELNELERQFLEESRDAEQDELHVARKRTRRLRVLAAMLAVLLAAAVVSALLAVRQTQRTTNNASSLRPGSSRVRRYRIRQPARSRALARARGLQNRPIAEARSALVTATQRSGRVRAVVGDQRSELTGVAFSSDGRTLATVDRRHGQIVGRRYRPGARGRPRRNVGRLQSGRRNPRPRRRGRHAHVPEPRGRFDRRRDGRRCRSIGYIASSPTG